MALLPRPTAQHIVDTAGTIGDSVTRHAEVNHYAASTHKETPATGVDGGRRLFHNFRPHVHHRPSQQIQILGRDRFRPLPSTQKARPRGQEAHQLRSLCIQRYTHTDLRMANPQA